MKDLLNKVAAVAGYTAAFIQINADVAKEYTSEMKTYYIKAKQKGDN